MATVHLHADTPPERVFAVVVDPWQYANWVVGAKKVRGVDPEWPRPGSRFHHRVGMGPATVDDSTVLEAIDPPRRLVLRVRARPLGVGRVELQFHDDGAGGTDIEMTEYPLGGVPGRWYGRLLDGMVAARNLVSLRRLRRLAETGAGAGSTSDDGPAGGDVGG